MMLLMSAIVSAEEVKNDIHILKIVDGDTYVISAPFIPKPLKQQIPLRLKGVDTPNIKRFANCAKEAELGEQAKYFVESIWKNSKKENIKFVGMDKYNRIIGEVYFDDRSIADLLIANKLARPYTGGKKESWCH